MAAKPATTEPTPPNLDEMFDRIKTRFTKEDRMALVEGFRAEREAWLAKEDAKQQKKDEK